MKTRVRSNFQSGRILRRHFEALKLSDGLSLRGLAELCGVSSAIVSQVLGSKKLASRRLLGILARALDLDALARSELEEAHSNDVMEMKGIAPAYSPSMRAGSSSVREIVSDDQVLLESWLHMALMESTGCVDFSEDTAALSRRFSVDEDEIGRAIAELERSGYLVRDAHGRFRKNDRKMRIPTARSRASVREFHSQMLKKGVAELEKHKRADFEARLITGYTIAVNPEHLESAKLILHKALLEIAEHLCSGNCRRVYQLQGLLFPLDRETNTSGEH